MSWTRIPNHTIPELNLGCCFGSDSSDVGYRVCSGATQPSLCSWSRKALSCLCWSLKKQISAFFGSVSVWACECRHMQAPFWWSFVVFELAKVMNKTSGQLSPLVSGMSQNKSKWVPSHMELLRTFVAEIVPAELCASVSRRWSRTDRMATVLAWEPQPCKVHRSPGCVTVARQTPWLTCFSEPVSVLIADEYSFCLVNIYYFLTCRLFSWWESFPFHSILWERFGLPTPSYQGGDQARDSHRGSSPPADAGAVHAYMTSPLGDCGSQTLVTRGLASCWDKLYALGLFLSDHLKKKLSPSSHIHNTGIAVEDWNVRFQAWSLAGDWNHGKRGFVRGNVGWTLLANCSYSSACKLSLCMSAYVCAPVKTQRLQG